MVKNPPACRRPGFALWVGKIPFRRNSYQLQYSGLQNSTDCIIMGSKELDTTEWTKYHFIASIIVTEINFLEDEMSILASYVPRP